MNFSDVIGILAGVMTVAIPYVILLPIVTVTFFLVVRARRLERRSSDDRELATAAEPR